MVNTISGCYSSSRRGTFLLVLSCFVIWIINVVVSIPPDDPIKCSNGTSNCVVTNAFGAFPDRSTCRAARAVYPTREEELIEVVREATKTKTKMKVVTKYAHSSSKLVCPGGDSGLVISTKNLNKVINVDATQRTITVESGVTLRKLINEAAKSNMALPHVPYWEGVTVGGIIATAAHGSSLWEKGSAVHDYVVGLRIVSPGQPQDDYVKVRTLGEGDRDLDAVKVSLGVLGVISQVTLKLQVLFKRNITYMTRDDDDIADLAIKFGREHEFADITWFPSQGKAIYRIDNRLNSTAAGDGVYNSLAYRSTPAWQLQLLRNLEETEESNGYDKVRCISSKGITSYLNDSAFGLTNDGKQFTRYPVIGYQHKIQTSGECLKNNSNDIFDTYCPWDPRAKGLFFYNNGFAIPLSKVKNFIQDIQQLVLLNPTSFCGIEMYGGILMRYVKASSAYLGKDEDGIDFDIPYYRSKNAMDPRIYEDVLDELEQIAIFKYGGLPHWGKNRNVAFLDVIGKYNYGDEFIGVKNEYDSLELFSSEWSDGILGLHGLNPTVKRVGCAREGLCLCSKMKVNVDYCGNGYSCQDGRVYVGAKVCRKDDDENLVSVA